MRAWAGMLLAALLCACSSTLGAGEPDGALVEQSCQDTQNDPMNCGACDRVCVIPNATAGCSLGECVIDACPSGFSDNDGDINNGCELAEGEDPDPLTCREDKSELCNAFDDNCDGQCDEGRAAGCRQAVHRGQGGGHHIFSTELSDVQGAPYALEAQDFFFTYGAPGVGLVEAFLCTKGDGTHFLTTSSACEGAGVILRSIGYWAAAASCDAVPLYRIYNGTSNNHFFTISAPERDSAVANLGYVDEGIVGYVFTAR